MFLEFRDWYLRFYERITLNSCSRGGDQGGLSGLDPDFYSSDCILDAASARDRYCRAL
jgi:hypothetical protein